MKTLRKKRKAPATMPRPARRRRAPAHADDKFVIRLTNRDFARIVNSAADGIVAFDRELRYIAWNEGMENFTGVAPREVLGRTALEAFPEIRGAKEESDLRAALAGKQFVVRDRPYLNRRGHSGFYEASYSPIRDEKGEIVGGLGVIRDITERKGVEAQLLEKSTELNAIFRALPDLFFRLDGDGKILDYHAGRAADLYMPPENFLGRRMQDVLPPEAGRRFDAALKSLRRDASRTAMDYSLRTPVGEQFFEARLLPLSFKDAQVLVFVRNITDRRRAEDALKLLVRVTAGAIEAAGVRDMISTSLQMIADLKGWKMGQAWLLNWADQTLHCSPDSYYTKIRAHAFRNASLKMVMRKGEGLPGRVWEAGAPIWISDVAKDPRFPRARYATAIGLRSAFAFPIRLNDRLFAILEFFDSDIRLPDRYFLEAVEKLGTHLAIVFERRRAEEALRKQREEQKTILDSVHAMIWYKDGENRILRANKAAAASAGLTVEQIEGRSTYDLYPDLAKKYLQDDLEVIRTERPKLGIIEPFRLPGGELRWVSTDKIPYRDEHGRTTGVVVVATDITEHKRVQEELEKSLLLLRGTLESTADGILVVDNDGKILTFNRRFTDLWRIPPAVMATKHDADAVNYVLDQLVDPAGFQDKIRQLYADPDTVTTDILEFKDGRIIERNSQPLDSHGRTFGRVYSFRDVTERQRYEKQLKERAEELARSNAELEQFAYVASHDLQEPVRTVASFAQILEKRYKDQLGEDGQKLIHYIMSGVTRMRDLINDLLDYSRVGTKPLAHEDVDCKAVLSDVLSNLAATIRDTSAVITHDSLPLVRWDARQLGVVLQNLIGNALKFYNKEPPRVHISVRKQGHEWVFSVRDNGIGIEPQYAERIFVIFQRLHSKQEYPGTGIGLAICKKIVERSGGRIWLDSVPGKGSTFHFTVPIREKPAGAIGGER